MSGISKLEFDGMTVSRNGQVTAKWAEYHYITVYFTCDIPYEPCHESFEIYIDGKKRYTTDVIDFPGQSWPLPPPSRPITIQLTNASNTLSPGEHTVIVKVIEHPVIGEPYPIDEFKVFVTVVKEEGQDTPYPSPPPAKPPWSLEGILSAVPWWMWVAGGIIAFAYFTKPSELEEVKELMKLKLMKELSEE